MKMKGNKDVLKFINDFVTLAKLYGIEFEPFRDLFEAGYCYYFACMLYHAFDRGTICICAPYGHIVWKDTDGTIYDINGVSDAEYEVLVPADDPDSHIIDFKRVPTDVPGISRIELEQLVAKYKEE